MKRKLLKLILILVVLGLGNVGLSQIKIKKVTKTNKNYVGTNEITVTPSTIPQSPTPTINQPKKLTNEELIKAYGPCANVKVLMYHHIQHSDIAKQGGYSGLNVTPDDFRMQMQYLRDHGYNVIFVDDIANFFNSGAPVPAKAVAITLDDAYVDNYTNAFPILKEFGIKATIFTPTGLVNNPNYLTWDQIIEMSNSGLIRFGNHTWSHHSSSGTEEIQDNEIKLADTQLREHGLNKGIIFAYPYGKPSSNAEKVLTKFSYNIAFTTNHGQMMCKGQRFELPRIRIGGDNLNRYGL